MISQTPSRPSINAIPPRSLRSSKLRRRQISGAHTSSNCSPRTSNSPFLIALPRPRARNSFLLADLRPLLEAGPLRGGFASGRAENGGLLGLRSSNSQILQSLWHHKFSSRACKRSFYERAIWSLRLIYAEVSYTLLVDWNEQYWTLSYMMILTLYPYNTMVEQYQVNKDSSLSKRPKKISVKSLHKILAFPIVFLP